MHVGALLPLAPPPGGTGPFLRGLRDELCRGGPVAPPWDHRLATPRLRHNPLQSWVEVSEVDLDDHVRRSSLPAPGDERELGIMLAGLHSNPMDSEGRRGSCISSRASRATGDPRVARSSGTEPAGERGPAGSVRPSGEWADQCSGFSQPSS
jgi:hypothetical protein